MVYYTGDIHGHEYEIESFCKRFKPTRDDIIVILGDVGANYGKDERDAELKKALNKLKPTILCIHGNHEIRPWNIPTYKSKESNISSSMPLPRKTIWLTIGTARTIKTVVNLPYGRDGTKPVLFPRDMC